MPPKGELQDITMKASNIKAAAEEILGIVDDTTEGNVLYFHGWDGLGASPTLRVVAQCLKSSTRSNNIEKVIYVDCSLWKSKRALQEAVAEELELPQSVMGIFSQRDEDDDFDGLDQGSRGPIADVAKEIFKKLANSRFLVIFINGSSEYIDLYECGVPVTEYLNNKLLWTFSGRFRVFPTEMSLRSLGVRISVSTELGDGELWDVVREEAEEVANYMGIPEPDMNHKIVECFLYAWTLRDTKGIDWGTHASNYWVCAGIVQGNNNTSAWEIGDALHRNMRMFPIWNAIGYHMNLCLQKTSMPQYLQQQEEDSLSAKRTSLFPAANSLPNTATAIPSAIFTGSQRSRLGVLHLSWCMFSFASPPFLCCDNLRFILLAHCKDENIDITDEEHQSQSKRRSWRPCFEKLWVLDLRYTDWYWLLSEEMMNIMADLRELNVEGLKHWSISDLRGNGVVSLVKLRVTSDSVPDKQAPFPDLSAASNLKMVILDGCVGLEQVSPDVLPPFLESFSFINEQVATAAKISSISFRGCAQLKSIVLRGLFGSLEEIDLSGTAVKTLDLIKLRARHLKRLILLGCDKLCAILWPPSYEMTRELEVLQIGTTRSASSVQAICEEKNQEAMIGTRSSSLSATSTHVPATPFDFNISIRDARLLWSTRALLTGFVKHNYYLHIEMDSSPEVSVVRGGRECAQGIRRLQQPDYYIYGRDVVLKGRLQDAAASEGVMWTWDCPPISTPGARGWYVHILDEDDMRNGLLQQQQQGSTERSNNTSAVLLPAYICNFVVTLHVHDSLSITSMPWPLDSSWEYLRWCRVERCPKLHTVFTFPQESGSMPIFTWLTAFWASQLSMARYIWNWNTLSRPRTTYSPWVTTFQELEFLHLDNCPRLIHVLPLSTRVTTLKKLETLEMVCCGNLKEIFPVDPERQGQQQTIEFPSLRRIRLHDLPMLQRICGLKTSTPNLESIKIRGCWGLQRLPACGGGNTKFPKVDCEKDWWDNLEWDGLPNHHPSLYQPRHSLYYKNGELPRGTVLR